MSDGDHALVGERVGRYQVEQRIGQGGMGVVFLATDTVLGRQVALKLLRDDLGLPPEVKSALFARMRNEARAAAALLHPHVVTLFDMGEDDTHGLYLVFEYVPGKTLRERIEDRPLGPSEAIHIVGELADALSAAHEAGIVHRDVKPENILLTPRGAKLADFGIARVPDSTLTLGQAVLGTPAYCAPETLSSADFGPASDQFSLAATAFEALTGQRAFPGDDALQVTAKVSAAQVPPLDGVALPEPALRALHAVLSRAMSKAPGDRFVSCRAFADRLAVAMSDTGDTGGLGAGATTPSRTSLVLRKRTNRIQNIVAAGGLLVIVTLVLIGRRQRATNDEGTAPSALPGAASAAVPSATATTNVKAKAPARKRALDAGSEAGTTMTRDAGAEAGTEAPGADVGE